MNLCAKKKVKKKSKKWCPVFTQFCLYEKMYRDFGVFFLLFFPKSPNDYQAGFTKRYEC